MENKQWHTLIKHFFLSFSHFSFILSNNSIWTLFFCETSGNGEAFYLLLYSPDIVSYENIKVWGVILKMYVCV